MADDGLSRLTEEEKLALVALVRRAIDADRYPLSPRISELRGILAKLEGGPKQAPAPAAAATLCATTGQGKAAESAGLAADAAVDFGLSKPQCLAHIRRASVRARGYRRWRYATIGQALKGELGRGDIFDMR